ncbi:hypothetical protein [Microbacterium sp. P04]|uniref:hypothetical protein n=1 Tax=Microbacterium sp. P04 TaxID=3366947 RepID=UPI00374734BB
MKERIGVSVWWVGLLAVPVVVVTLTREDLPTSTGWSPAERVVIVALFAIHTALAVALWRSLRGEGRQWKVPVLGLWYAAGGAAGACFAAASVRAGGMNVFTAIALAVGALSLMFAANYALRLPTVRPEAHPDIATFLGSSHALGFLVLGLFVVTAFQDQNDRFTTEVLRTGVLALTLLAYPTVAGFAFRVGTTKQPKLNRKANEERPALDARKRAGIQEGGREEVTLTDPLVQRPTGLWVVAGALVAGAGILLFAARRAGR